MPLLFSLETARDWVIVIYGIVGVLFFLVGIAVMLLVGLTAKGLLKAVRDLMDENVKPALGSIRDAADTVRGTTEFVGQTAVTPIMRTYGAFAGVKKGLGVLTSLSGRGKKGA